MATPLVRRVRCVLDDTPEIRHLVSATGRLVSDLVLMTGLSLRFRKERPVLTVDLVKSADGVNPQMLHNETGESFTLQLYDVVPPAMRYVVPERVHRRIVKDRRWAPAVSPTSADGVYPVADFTPSDFTEFMTR